VKAAAARPHFQYAAKFICTTNAPGTSQTTSSLLPGNYTTVVNVHNPHEEKVQLREKLALGPDHHTPFYEEDVLGPDGMVRLDCETITRRFGPFIHGVEGFLVIECSHSLDVVAVYTAGPRGGEVASIDVEQVRERVIRGG
jgi:hypothetical protein